MKKILILLNILVIGLIYRNWLNPLSVVSAGDLPFFWPDWLGRFILNFSFSAWAPSKQLGGNAVYILNSAPYDFFTGLLLKLFSNNFYFVQKIVWLWAFLALSFFSSYTLVKRITDINLVALLGSFIYMTNTYILMILGGGQIAGLGLAYAIAPLVFYFYLELIDRIKNRESIKHVLNASLIFGFVLAVLVTFDLRFAYLTIFMIILHLIFDAATSSKALPGLIYRYLLFVCFIPGFVASLLNLFWLLPFFLLRENPIAQLGNAYGSIEAVKFFSFSNLENSISLLHPNWPENIFGKVSFMYSEFILLPILAYSSLLFLKPFKKNYKYVIFFALLGIISAFLAKGANQPFGEIYLWLFSNVPGFNMFRDSTKWYLLVSISYSVLIPFTVGALYNLISLLPKFQIPNSKFQIRSKNRFINFQNIFLCFVLLYLLFLIRPALLGELGGTFKNRTIPEEYAKLERYLVSDKKFSRALWVPSLQRFGFYSHIHPAISGLEFYKTTSVSGVVKEINNPIKQEILEKSAVKYVIVPFDSEGEIFLKDRKYNNLEYKQAIEELGKINWLKRVDGFGRIAVFEVSNSADHFWISNNSAAKINYSFIEPIKYYIDLKNVKKGNLLVFSEKFNKYWYLNTGGEKIYSKPYSENFNSFQLPKDGSYKGEVYYQPQNWVNIGLLISLVTLFTLIIYFAAGSVKSKKLKI